MSEVSEMYKEAINHLQAVSGDFAIDEGTRGAVNAEIAALRNKIQDAALDDVASRTANLQALSSRLSKVLQKAQGGDTSALQALSQKVRGSLGI